MSEENTRMTKLKRKRILRNFVVVYDNDEDSVDDL